MKKLSSRTARAAVTAGLAATLVLSGFPVSAIAETAGDSSDAAAAEAAGASATTEDATADQADAVAPAAGTVATVTNDSGKNDTYESFSAAINAAAAGDKVTLTASTSENVAVRKKITVTAATGAVYSGTMSVHDGATITGMTFSLTGQGGNNTSVSVQGAGDVTVSNNTFGVDDNAATSNYYGVYVQLGSARVNVTGNTFNYKTVAKNKERVAVNVQGNPTIDTVNVTNNTLNVTGTDAGKGTIQLVTAFGNNNADYGIKNLAITGNTVSVPEGIGDNVIAVSVQGVSGLTFTDNTVKGADTALGAAALPGQKSESAGVTVGGNALEGTTKGYALGKGSLADDAINVSKPDTSEAEQVAPSMAVNVADKDGKGSYYADLAAAFAKAADGSTVTVLKNLTGVATVSKNVTLDLDGHTLETNGGTLTVSNGGKLTVTDSVGNGSVSNAVDGTSAPLFTVADGAELLVESGTFTTKGSQLVDAKGTVAISGGTFSLKPEAAWVVAGYGAAKNDDGTYGIAKAELNFTDAAKGGVYSLDAATGVSVTKADLLKLAAVNVEDYTVDVDVTNLDALNKAIAEKDTSKTFTFTFTATKVGANAAAGDTALTKTLTVTLTDSTPAAKTWKVTFVDGFESTADPTVEVKDGETVAKPADPTDLTDSGWKFVGWFTTLNADGSVEGEYDFAQPVTGDLTLYAGWVKGDGTTPVDPDKINNGGEPDKQLPQTGDTTNLAVPVAIGVAGAAVVGGALVMRRRQQ